MLRKRLLTVVLLTPLVAVSSLALANHNVQHKTNVTTVSKSCTYQGGPKTGSWACTHNALAKARGVKLT